MRASGVGALTFWNSSFQWNGRQALMMARLLRRVREDVVPAAHRGAFLAAVPEFIRDPRFERLREAAAIR